MATAFKQSDDLMAAAREEAFSMPLDQIDVADGARFVNNTFWPFFERLRRDAPIHYCADSKFGPYWSVTRYKDIMAVDTNHAIFSSDAHLGGITVADMDDDFILPMFIAMDPPKHDVQRKAVSPIVAPANLAVLEVLIRERAQKIFDNLPINEPFDWVDRVSIELTTQMLATLFDFPWEERRKLTYWSDIATSDPELPGNPNREERQVILLECLQYFTNLWNERVNAEPKGDLISMMAHDPATRDMAPMEYLGNLILLIVGGNDTTRNSISGGLLFLNENPDQYEKLRNNHSLVES
ncbi:MAG TPA: cytochrome P450, partial [Polymorphobacter sp.]|nr:cytochrome P450 [Polymorphobacter sp.]